MATAVQQKLPEQDNSGMMELLKIFLSGSGSGTTTTNSSASPQANAKADQLFAQLQSGSDPKLLQDFAANILDQANQAVAPHIGTSIGAGNRAFTDTTLQDSIARARAYATQAIAKGNLDFIGESNRTAAGLVQSQLNANKTTTQKTGSSPGNDLLKIGAGAVGAYSLAKKVGAVDKIKEIFGDSGVSSAADIFGEGTPGAVADFVSGNAANIGSADFFNGTEAFGDASGSADFFNGADAFGDAGGGGFSGAGSLLNLATGNNKGGSAGESFVLSQIPGVGPILALANSLDVPIVSDVVDVAGDFISDIGDSIGCFITTAVMNATKEADNGYTLETLRKFRDEYMVNNPEYAGMLKQYYHEAPTIVKLLDSTPNPQHIYQSIYTAFIEPAIAAIEQNQMEAALKIYATMFYFTKAIAALIQHKAKGV